jgi:hypothetical protein
LVQGSLVSTFYFWESPSKCLITQIEQSKFSKIGGQGSSVGRAPTWLLNGFKVPSVSPCLNFCFDSILQR